MKKYIANYIVITFIFRSIAQAQIPLPDEYFLLRVDSIPKNVEEQF